MTTPALHPATHRASPRQATHRADFLSACDEDRRAVSDGTHESEVRRRLPELLPDLEARALRLARDRALAEDTLQDAIERALRFEHQYEPNSNLRAWLLRILQSVFISRCRSRRRELRAMQALTGDPCAPLFSEATAPRMSELSPNTARALGAIPGSFRQAIELVDLAELSYRDAAETIGVPLGTVMSRLHRGRRLLAQALGEAQAATHAGGSACAEESRGKRVGVRGILADKSDVAAEPGGGLGVSVAA